MISPHAADRLNIQITTDCPRGCSNCVDLAPHFRRHGHMPLPLFRQIVDEVKGWLRPGKVLCVTGGEPTRHPDFEALSLALAQALELPPLENGRKPQPDLNALALRRLMDRTGGCGLSTSLGDGFYRHYETIFSVYGHLDIESHDCGKRHHAVMIDRADYCATTGMSDQQWQFNRDHCVYQQNHGGAVNERGAYFCPAAASLDRLLFNGAHAWEIKSGWWHRPFEDFGDQLTLCDYCALAQPVPSQVDALGRDIVGRAAWRHLKESGSPQPMELFGPLHRRVNHIPTDDPFAPGDQPRIGAANRSLTPRKLSCVLVSVGYGPSLAETLPRNMPHCDQMVVVTTPEDQLSRDVAEEWGATVVLSRRCYDDDHAFNKGRMLNDGIAALDNPDWILLTDADIILHPSTRAYLMGRALNPGCLHFTMRIDRSETANQRTDNNIEPNGYFQLYHPSAKAMRGRADKPVSEAFCSAGSVDSWFHQQWPDDMLTMLPEIAVEHLSSRWLAENWNGMADRKGRWCQFGLMTVNGLVAFDETQGLPEELLLTDTLDARSLLIRTNRFYDYVQITDQGLVFDGKVLGTRHIHIAYRAKT